MTNGYVLSDADAPAAEGEGREVPFDLAAERTVVGSMMWSTTAVDDVLEEMTVADLYGPKHQIVAESVIRLAMAGSPTDPISVVDELTRRGELGRAGGAETVHELHGTPVTWANAGYYARIVHEHAVRRRVIESATRMMSAAYSREREVDQIVEDARREVETVETGRRRQARMIGENFDGLIDSLQHEPKFLATPWESVDKIIGGFAPGALYVVAARPGEGKTIAVLQAAVALARKGTVAFSSIEMTEDQLQRRLIAQFGPLNLERLRSHKLSDDEWKTFAHARASVAGAPIAVDYEAAVTIADIRAHARAVARRGNLVGVVVDYLQLVQGEGQDRRVVVDNVAWALKQLAKDLDVPVIAAAQLKRPAPQRGGKKRVPPTLEDLREAGGIENSADVVMLLSRGQDEDARKLVIEVAKNRHGDRRQVTLRWEGEYARLLDRKWSPTALIEDLDESA